jgi:hypothetical protein
MTDFDGRFHRVIPVEVVDEKAMHGGDTGSDSDSEPESEPVHPMRPRPLPEPLKRLAYWLGRLIRRYLPTVLGVVIALAVGTAINWQLKSNFNRGFEQGFELGASTGKNEALNTAYDEVIAKYELVDAAPGLVPETVLVTLRFENGGEITVNYVRCPGALEAEGSQVAAGRIGTSNRGTYLFFVDPDAPNGLGDPVC